MGIDNTQREYRCYPFNKAAEKIPEISIATAIMMPLALTYAAVQTQPLPPAISVNRTMSITVCGFSLTNRRVDNKYVFVFSHRGIDGAIRTAKGYIFKPTIWRIILFGHNWHKLIYGWLAIPIYVAFTAGN